MTAPQPLSRRWFLRGLGGATLAIPALPSLLVGAEARAQAAVSNKLFVAFSSAYGGTWATNFFPSLASPEASKTYAGRVVRKKALTVDASGRLSEVLQSGGLTQKLASKMNLLQGIDFPFAVNHHWAGGLGNYGSCDTPSPIGANLQANPRPTIDQVIAHSSAFYPSLQGVTQRSVFATDWGKLSYRYKDPTNKAAGVEPLPYLRGPTALWDMVFKDYNAGPAPRPAILDLVKADYARLKANPRLGSEDKKRLEGHLQRVSDIERRTAVTSVCGKPPRPTDPPNPKCGDPANNANYYRAYQDVLIAALDCGLTRVATLLFDGNVSTFGATCDSAWHQEVSHLTAEPGPQAQMVAAFRKQFSEVILPFVSKMDSIVDMQGQSLLDRSLVMWVHEHGSRSHGIENVPVVTLGSAGGAMRTGQHIDYRDLNRPLPITPEDGPSTNRRYVGLTVHQMLGSMLQVMGIPKAEWAESNHGGYGYRAPNLEARQASWGAAEWNAAGDVLPYLTA